MGKGEFGDVGEKLKAARQQAEQRGHSLPRFSEEYPGKWVVWCERCNRMVIVYDEPPYKMPEVFGKALKEDCSVVR